MSDTDALTLPLPSLPGLVFRRILGVQDAEGMRAVHDARAALLQREVRSEGDLWSTQHNWQIRVRGDQRPRNSHYYIPVPVVNRKRYELGIVGQNTRQDLPLVFPQL